jgi:hypothetical protein
MFFVPLQGFSGRHSFQGAIQMHEALVSRLTLESTLEVRAA